MKTSGIICGKNDLRVAILEFNDGDPTLLLINRIPTIATSNVNERMVWYKSEFNSIIANHRPNKIAYKIDPSPSSLGQIQSSIFGLGVLNLIAAENSIQTQHFIKRSIIASKIGGAKDDDLSQYIEAKFGEHKPYWDISAKEAIALAWIIGR